MPGPPSKPTAPRIVQGSLSKRKLNRDEPKFSGVPACPDWLTTSAKEEWRRVTCELAALDMLQAVDSSAQAAYWQSYVG
jgi:phage terminase small subunit